jgi:hypothetical protein
VLGRRERAKPGRQVSLGFEAGLVEQIVDVQQIEDFELENCLPRYGPNWSMPSPFSLAEAIAPAPEHLARQS